MIVVLENNSLRIEIASAGAELVHIHHKDSNREYLWQGSKDWWPRRAPVLFPIVGKLNNNQYHLGDKAFSLPQHGFARDQEFELDHQDALSVRFVLKSNSELLTKIPFPFELGISYKLERDLLTVQYEVKNKDADTMWFSLGAHPGFGLADGEALADYDIEFEKKETLDRFLLDDGLFNGKTENVLINSNILPLNDSVFTKDAIVFKNMKSNWLLLKSRKSDYKIKFAFDSFPYFGIWSKPGAPFVCLEPWCGLADSKGFEGDFKTKEGIEQLRQGEVFKRAWSVSF